MQLGKPSRESQIAELVFWSKGGSSQWDLHLRYYETVFPIRTISYDQVHILDVGSGPISVWEKHAPSDAQITPYDTLADDYNRIAQNKKFLIHSEIPSGQYTLITLFNCLDHMDDPNELLCGLTRYLDRHGELWVYCHIDRPFSPEEHPQDFRFWQIIKLVHRHYEIKKCGLIREGRLFPYAWWGVCGPRVHRVIQYSENIWTTLLIIWCAVLYGRFHAQRAIIKLLKLVGLRRLLPKELQF
jgi:hypothetical protein